MGYHRVRARFNFVFPWDTDTRMWLALLLLLAGCDRLLGLDTVPSAPTDAMTDVGFWSAVAAGETHTCAVRDDSTLWCWGRNDANQIAVGPDILEADTPFSIPGAWKTVVTSYETTCGIQTDGGPWIGVSVGYYFACGLDSAHAVWCGATTATTSSASTSRRRSCARRR